MHETFNSVKYPATAKIVARQVARAVAESRIKFYFSCSNLGPSMVCYTVKSLWAKFLFKMKEIVHLQRLKAIKKGLKNVEEQRQYSKPSEVLTTTTTPDYLE